MTTKSDLMKICLMLSVVFTFSQFIIHYEFSSLSLAPTFNPPPDLKLFMTTYYWSLKAVGQFYYFPILTTLITSWLINSALLITALLFLGEIKNASKKIILSARRRGIRG